MLKKMKIAKDPQILVILLLCGCASQHRDLAFLDTHHIIEIAKQELKEKAPDFQQSKYIPDSIAYKEYYFDNDVGQSIVLEFRSKEPISIEERASHTNGHLVIQASTKVTDEIASVTMSPQGELIRIDQSEYEDFHDWQYVRYYQVFRSIKKFPDQPRLTSLLPTNAPSIDSKDPFCLPVESP